MPFEETLVEFARVSPFLAYTFVLLSANLFVLVVSLVPLVFRPTAFSRVMRSSRFWVLAVAASLGISVLGAGLLSLFPEGKRLVPLLCLIALGLAAELWVKRRAERGRDATAA